MMLHPDRDQILQILPLGEYPGDKRNVNRVKLGGSMETEFGDVEELYEGEQIGERISGFKANMEK